jgi:hypothetical protein
LTIGRIPATPRVRRGSFFRILPAVLSAMMVLPCVFNRKSQKKGNMMDKKDAYVQKMKAKLDEWSAEIDRLKAKADQAEADSRIEYYNEIEDLRKKQRAAEEKLERLRRAGDGAWEDLKTGIDDAWRDIQTAVKSATSRFK